MGAIVAQVLGPAGLLNTLYSRETADVFVFELDPVRYTELNKLEQTCRNEDSSNICFLTAVHE